MANYDTAWKLPSPSSDILLVKAVRTKWRQVQASWGVLKSFNITILGHF